MTLRRVAGAAAVLVWLAGVAGGCSVAGERSSPPGASGAATTVPGRPPASAGGRGTLRWRSCRKVLQCARLDVPVDENRPDGPTLSLAIARRPARKPSERIGSLLVNPGGPGGSAIEVVEGQPFPSKLRDRFDIVGFDPRGVGDSTPLDCHAHLQTMYDADPTIDDAGDQARFLDESRAFVEECRRRYADLLPHLGTRDVAHDMDRVRTALGDEKLTYVGYSYGTSIGQQYAELFPTRIRAMVLDGVVDMNLTGLAAADLQAKGFESALDTYLADCRRTRCPLGADPAATLDRVVAAAERSPIESADADRPATPGVIELAISQGLYDEQLWPTLTRALVDADRDHDGSGLVDLADAYLRRRPDGTYPAGLEMYFAVACLDSAWPRDPQAVFAAAKATGARYPRLGEGLVNDYVRCALWPTPSQPLSTGSAPGSPPILVVSTTGDPATPYESGVAVAGRLSQGVLLTNVGRGHTVFAQGKACVDNAVTRYLVDLVAPRHGLRCR